MRWTARVRDWASGGLARNAAALYTAHVTSIALSLIAIPFLARVLRPEGWGVVVFAQSFAAVLTLLLEYGFYLSASREIARHRDDPDRVAQIVADVQAARFILLGAVSLLALASFELVPVFREHPTVLFWAWVLAVGQGFSSHWYYQGVERQAYPALAEALAKVIATAVLLILVRGPDDGPLVLAIYGIALLLWSAVTNLAVYRSVPAIPPRFRGGLSMLRASFQLFVFRAASGSYATANSFILGAMAVPQVVAFFGGAERLIRGATNFINPATQVIYPRVSHLVVRDRGRAGEILGLSMLLVGGIGLTIGFVAAAGAPLLVALFLGPGYEAAVPVVRTLAVLPPIVAVSTVLGLQWAIPVGLERPYFRLVVSGALINLVLAVALVPPFGPMGMAAAVVLAELTVFAGLLLLARRHGAGIWSAAFAGLFAFLRRRRVPAVVASNEPPRP